MDPLGFLKTKQAVAGLSISDSALRLALLKQPKGRAEAPLEPVVLAEEVLLPGEIANGVVLDEARFLATLQKLFDRTGIKYVVLSLPADGAFAKIHRFPADIGEAKLKSSLELITHFQLPQPPDRIYADWQRTGPTEVLLAFAQTKAVDQLLGLLKRLGLTAVAVECQGLSLARAFDSAQDGTYLAVTPGQANNCLAVINRTGLRLLHCAGAKADLTLEAQKTIASYEYKNETIKGLCLMDDFGSANKTVWPLEAVPFPLAPDLTAALGGREANAWAAALGAAKRGLLARSQDKEVSLMEIGTEEAYKRQTAVAFATFLSSLTIGLSLLLAAVFAAAWVVMISLQQNFNQQIDAQRGASQGTVLAELESQAARFNALVGPLSQIVRQGPDWTPLLADLSGRLRPGITLTGFTVPGPNQPISLVGNARTRQDLNDFKQALAESPLITSVNLPLDNLGKKSDIPFSLSLTLKPEAVTRQLE